MDLRLLVNFIFFAISKASISDINTTEVVSIPDNVFNGVYSECFLHLSYSCLQKKTLLYLKELNNLSEVSVIGDYVKFVKINKSEDEEAPDEMKTGETEELAFMIDKAIDNFFDNHVLKFYALGRNISMPRNAEGFVGRKKRRGGGGGGGGHGGHDGGGGGHDDGGKKKMMMMAMMCMKMKLMMMVPAMMGMMGMMSFKGMMFSMMSFMISKMMLLMKILEKKGAGGLGGGGGGGGLDGGWAAGGAGGGAWMPAGGQDYSGGGGGGGGYDANGQWQSRSIVEKLENYKTIDSNPVTFVKPIDIMKWHKDFKKDTQNSDKWMSKTAKIKPTETVNKPVDKYQWKSRSIDENLDPDIDNKPEISFVKRTIRFNNKVEKEKETYKNPVLFYKKSNVNFDFNDPDNNVGLENDSDTENKSPRSKRDLKRDEQENNLDLNDYKFRSQASNDKGRTNKHFNAFENEKSKLESKQRQKRGVIDLLQNSYIYWVNRILGLNNNRRTNPQRYKIVNGVKYVYYPYKLQKPKMPKGIPMTQSENLKPLVAIEEFNKGEIVDGGVDAIESRMIHKKLKKMKDTVNDTVEDNPWE